MAFDDVFDHIGGIGLYQIGLYLLLGLPSFYGGYQSMAMTFLGPNQDHWCKVDRLQNLSATLQKYIAIPYNEKTKEYEQCKYYDHPYDNFTDAALHNWNWTEHGPVTTKPCEDWVFDESEYSSTAIQKYLLVCDRKFLASLVFSSFTASTLVSNFIAGPLSDRFGRKRLLMIAVSFEGILATAAAFAPNYPLFLVLRFLTAVSITFACSCCFVLSVEVFGPQYRAIAGGLFWLFWSFGYLTLPGIALLVKDYRMLQITLAIPMFITLCYFILVSESPRWLISQNRIDEAKKIIATIAKVNRKAVPENIDDILIGKSNKSDNMDTNVNASDQKLLKSDSDIAIVKKKSMNFSHLLTVPLLRRHLFLILPAWIGCTLTYYGISFNTGSMVGNVYLNTFLVALVEVPAYLVSLPLMYKLGRRYSQIGTMLVAGVACFICIPFLLSDNKAYNIAVITLMIIGKAAVTTGFAVIFVYTAELFPTPIRHQGVATPYMSANIFGLATPFMGSHMMNIWKPLPLVIFGSLGIVSGILVFFLPETCNVKLPDNLHDLSTMDKQKKMANGDSKHHEMNELTNGNSDNKC